MASTRSGCKGAAIILAVVFVCIAAIGAVVFSYANKRFEKIQQEEESRPILKVNAVDLNAEYEANQVAADAKYKNQILDVTGIVSEIGKDLRGDPFVGLLKAANNPFPAVRASFGKWANPDLAQLSKGQPITIRGRCGSYFFQSVRIEDCQLVK
jgi:hypothetical protein